MLYVRRKSLYRSDFLTLKCRKESYYSKPRHILDNKLTGCTKG